MLDFLKTFDYFRACIAAGAMVLGWLLLYLHTVLLWIESLPDPFRSISFAVLTFLQFGMWAAASIWFSVGQKSRDSSRAHAFDGLLLGILFVIAINLEIFIENIPRYLDGHTGSVSYELFTMFSLSIIIFTAFLGWGVPRILKYSERRHG